MWYKRTVKPGNFGQKRRFLNRFFKNNFEPGANFKKQKNTFCRILHSEQNGILDSQIWRNHIFLKIAQKGCLKLPSVSGNIGQVLFLCKISTTCNFLTLLGITKSFESVN